MCVHKKIRNWSFPQLQQNIQNKKLSLTVKKRDYWNIDHLAICKQKSNLVGKNKAAEVTFNLTHFYILFRLV